MAPKNERRGLGRGLSALMADVAPATESESVAPRDSGQTLPIEQLVPNPDQPRRDFSQEDLDSLADSIREKGVIQPLIVRPMPGGSYQIVAGERRWRASQQAQVHEVPVIIRDFTDTEVLEVAIIENIQRADLNAIEEALAYRQLMDRFGHTQEKVASALGKSRSHIANLLRLLNLPQSVVDMVREGALSAGHARALVTVENAADLARQAVTRGLSVRELERLVKTGSTTPKMSTTPSTSTPVEKDADTRALEGDLSATLGMSVSINHESGGVAGRVTIRYNSLEQLDDLCARLSGTA